MRSLAKQSVMVVIGIILLAATLFYFLEYPTRRPAPSSRVAERPVWVVEEQTFQGEADRDGWSCVVSISNTADASTQTPPVCRALIKNRSTHVLRCWVGYDGEQYSKIELLDSNGIPVERTEQGGAIGTRVTDAGIRDMARARYKAWRQGRARTPGFASVRPGKEVKGVGFDIAGLFQLKQGGAYTLKVQTCLIQSVGEETHDPMLKIIRPPEVVAKFTIRPIEPGKVDHRL